MTNSQIIISEAIANGIYTKDSCTYFPDLEKCRVHRKERGTRKNHN